MNILVLSFYFRPDLCAGSFRISSLVDELLKEGITSRIDVMTTMPNRYNTFRQGAEPYEQIGNLQIFRFSIPAHRSGMVDQALSYFSYARQVIRAVASNDYDVVFASSSRLMTASLGAVIAAWMRVPLYLDIRDLFTDTMNDLLRGRAAKLLLPVFMLLERFTVRRAGRVNVVSEAFLPHFRRIAANKIYRFFPNGIDAFFLDRSLPLPPRCGDRKEILIVCAGNMGEGQGLHHIIPPAAKALSGKARFRLIGDGGRRAALEEGLEAQGIENVEILAPVPREELMLHYAEADILFLHLNDVPAFKKVLPSKIFEYGAVGRPVLAGVSGYSREFLNDHVDGSYCFPPCDAAGLVAAFESLLVGAKSFDRSAFVNEFDRASISRRMSKDILAFAAQPPVSSA